MSPQVQTLHFDGFGRRLRAWNAEQKVSFRINEVCETCNSEWLSDLETRSERVLTPLMTSSQRVAVPPSDQRIIEEWVLKMALVSQATQREHLRIFQRDQYRQFREHGNVAPLATRAYIASYAEPKGPFMTHTTWTPLRVEDMRFPSDPEAEELVTSTFVIGHFVAQLCVAKTHGGDEATVPWVLEPHWTLSVRQLTGRSTDIRWPIVPPLRTVAELMFFASRDDIRVRQQLYPRRLLVTRRRPRSR